MTPKFTSLWEARWSCVAHTDRRAKFMALTFESALARAKAVVKADEHGGYTHVLEELRLISDRDISIAHD